ncbi:hypothetical protein ACFL6U_18585 [Planctomycetota bacterium]
MSEIETCSNCACEIPPSEQAHVFNGKIVCAKCDRGLRTKEKLKSYDSKQLKLLYARSGDVSTAAILSVLPTLIYTGAAIGTVVSPTRGVDVVTTFMVSFIFTLGSFIMIFALPGMFMRTSWGRTLGIIGCILGFIGLLWMFAFIRAPELFGPDKITRKELIEEMERRNPQAGQPAKSRLGRVWQILTKKR